MSPMVKIVSMLAVDCSLLMVSGCLLLLGLLVWCVLAVALLLNDSCGVWNIEMTVVFWRYIYQIVEGSL